MHRRLVPSHLSGLAWAAALAATAGLTWFLRSDATRLRGIAEADETSVSSESAVEILSVGVVPGQEVRAGDTLVRLSHPDLAVRIAELRRQIDGTGGGADLDQADRARRIAEVRSSLESRRAELQSEIRELVDQEARNRGLLSDLGAGTGDDGQGLRERVAALKRRIAVEEDGACRQIALLEGSRGSVARVARAQQDALGAELAMLEEQEARLSIVAPSDGVVGSVNFRAGEKVSPFAPILTVSGYHPTLVRAYVHELSHSDVRPGDSVEVASTGLHAARARGVVVGLGSRIIEFPARLRKIPQIPQWGREVVVRIPAENTFLLGEMVGVELPGARMSP